MKVEQFSQPFDANSCDGVTKHGNPLVKYNEKAVTASLIFL